MTFKTNINEKTGCCSSQQSIDNILRKRSRRWLGHVTRIDHQHIPQQAMCWKVSGYKRGPGCIIVGRWLTPTIRITRPITENLKSSLLPTYLIIIRLLIRAFVIKGNDRSCKGREWKRGNRERERRVEGWIINCKILYMLINCYKVFVIT